MKWKRNISSYPFWGLMILIGVVGLVLSTINASFAFGANEVVGAVICVVLLTIAGSGTYFLHIYKTNHPYENEYPIWVYALFGLILIGGIAGSIAMAVMNIPAQELTSPYFYAAEVQAGCRAPYFVHGATNTYVAFLNKVFFFFGNRAIMGIYAQIVLWIAVILFLGAGVWLAMGKKAAFVAMMCAAVIPALREEAVKLSPIMLYLACWSAVFAWLCLSERFRKKEIVTGISCFLIGLCIYFDLSGILLLPLYIALVSCKKNIDGVSASKKKILLRIAVGAVALVAAFFLCIAMDASLSEKPFADVLKVWFTTYPGGEIFPKQLYVAVTGLEFIPVYFLICLGAFAFWRDKNKDAFKGWMAGLLLVAAFFACGFSSERVTGEVFLAIMLYILAGIGLDSVLAVVENKPSETVPEPDTEQEEKPKKKKEKKKNKASETKIPVMDDIDKWIPLEEELDAVLAADNQEPIAPVQQAKKEEPTAEPEKQEIKFLENPLPLPKKHEKRTVDFPIASAEDDDYDYAVAEDDDYDIQ